MNTDNQNAAMQQHSMETNGNYDGQLLNYARELEEQHQALMQAKTTAEKSSRAKSEFLAHMSHEIRTPLNAVLGVASLLSDTELNDEQRNWVNIIRSSGDVLLSIINDILDVSKIEVGQLVLENAPFNLGEAIQGVTQSLNCLAQEKGVVLRLEMGDINRIYKGDITRLRQVLMNLIGNAIKFTSQGEVCLRVKTYPCVSRASRIYFEVEDTGIGIAPDKIGLIFDKFSQADESITRQYGGTGLGLSICKSLIALMGGKIEVTSEVGKGSCFRFDISLTCQSTQKVEHVSAPPSAIRFTNKRALLVDDIELNLTLLKAMLTKAGFDVVLARSGAQALAAIAQQTFDIILMDCHMPVMNGYEVVRHIRQIENESGRGRQTIIALTADAMKDNMERCSQSGMDDFMSKPVAKDRVLGMLVKWLGMPEHAAVS